MRKQRSTLIGIILLFVSVSYAQRDFSDVAVKSTKIRESLYLLEGVGGRQIASIGSDGVLLVDASWKGMGDKIKAELKKLGGGSVKYIVNTHWHPDHTDGNRAFAEEVTIIAHQTVRQRLSSEENIPDWARGAALPAHALPSITFDSSATIFFNGEEVELVKRSLCHTESDVSVFFKNAKVLHLGDAFIDVNAFPPLNPKEACGVTVLQQTLDRLIRSLPEDVIIVTGHGKLARMRDLIALQQLVDESIEIVRKRMSEGRRLQQIQAEGLPEKYADWGKKFAPADEWLALVYLSLRLEGQQ